MELWLLQEVSLHFFQLALLHSRLASQCSLINLGIQATKIKFDIRAAPQPVKVSRWLRHRQFKPRQLLLSGENKFKTFKIMAPLRGHAFPYGLPYPGTGLGHLGWPPSMPPSVSPGGGPGHHGMPPPLHHLPPLPNGAHPHNPFAQQHSQQDMKNAPQPEKKEPHVKKPLNAFMIYMKVLHSQQCAQ